MKYLAIIMLLASCAVSKTKLSEDGLKVKVTYTKPRGNCTPFKNVIGMNEDGIKELAINHAINLAADEGADTIYIKESINQGKVWKVYGLGYNCK